MKVLVTGVGGQLGFDVMRELAQRGMDCLGADRAEFDITDADATRKFITAYAPDAVIHCSAYTAVDAAEDEKEICRAVNAGGTENIAKVCREIGAKMLYISTDYVFPGNGDRFYEPTDPVAPCNVYGETKLAGEEVVQAILTRYFIVRISWVFGKNGNNFIKTMLRLGREREELSVVSDQWGSPTYTKDLAPLLCDMVATEKYGVYHATNEGVTNWADFAKEIFKAAEISCKVHPVSTEEYPTKAVRPKNSRLSKTCLDEAGFTRLPDWQDALRRYLEELAVDRRPYNR